MFRAMKKFAAAIFVAIGAGCGAYLWAASAPKSDAATAKPVLVELFTSEGCSSCPPADDLLRQVNGKRTAAGQLIVGISEHVTYWNADGWSDPFSSQSYTDRQSAYAGRFGLNDVYTPQMVIDGDEQIVGSDRAAFLRALKDEQQRPSPVSVCIQSAAVDGRSLEVSYSALGDGSIHKADIFAVIADDTDQSSVARGENSGRTLVHVSVARSISRISKAPSDEQQRAEILLPPSFKASQGHHLIVFAQAPGNQHVLGIDTKEF
jgi:hypothetical protein